jgi:hypothetical protein
LGEAVGCASGGLKAKGGAILLDCSVPFPRVHEEVRGLVAQARVVRQQADCLFIARDGLVGPAEPFERRGQDQVIFSAVRLLPDEQLRMGQGFCLVAFFQVENSPIRGRRSLFDLAKELVFLVTVAGAVDLVDQVQ